MKILLIFHGIIAIAMLGASTHNGILTILLMRGKNTSLRLHKIYSAVLFWSFLANFLLGLFIYVEFRTAVRAAWLDSNVPLATGFFEVKEHALALAMGVLLWYYPYVRRLRALPDPSTSPFFSAAGLYVMGTVWLSALTGLLLVTLKSI